MDGFIEPRASVRAQEICRAKCELEKEVTDISRQGTLHGTEGVCLSSTTCVTVCLWVQAPFVEYVSHFFDNVGEICRYECTSRSTTSDKILGAYSQLTP